MYSPQYKNKINKILLSNNTITKAITDLSEDIEVNVNFSRIS